MAMTEKQKLFCETYLANGFNARNSYYIAFPGADPENRQPSYPYTLLKKPEIKEYIDMRRKEIYESLCVDSTRIADKLATVAFADKFDEHYNVTAQLKALELLQKQFGLQNQKIESKVQHIEVGLVDDED